MSADTPAEQPTDPSRTRKWIVFLIGFPISLAVGWVFQIITNPATYIAAEELQLRWYKTVSKMSPVALVTGYVDDVITVATSDPFAKEAPLRPLASPQALPAGPETECEKLDKALPPPCTTPLGTYDHKGLAACTAANEPALARFREKCPGIEPYSLRYKRVASAPKTPLYTGPRPAERTEWPQIIASPLFGILLTWNRLTAEGGISYLLAVVMLAGGLLGFMVMHAKLFSPWNQTHYFPQNIWAKLLLVPPAVIACASVVCFLLKYLMLGALAVFGWITGLAAMCCGAVGFGGYCWWCFHKFAQYSVGKAVAPKA